jgi:hypothetical protein
MAAIDAAAMRAAAGSFADSGFTRMGSSHFVRMRLSIVGVTLVVMIDDSCWGWQVGRWWNGATGKGGNSKATADPPFGFAQGRHYGDDNKKCKGNGKCKCNGEGEGKARATANANAANALGKAWATAWVELGASNG